ADRVKEVHVLFNNNRSNYAVVNGLQMGQLLDLGLPSPESIPSPAPDAEQTELPFGGSPRGRPKAEA
ncbi:MAG TPA: hypothetical protein DCL83_17665, partial [Arthrobacter bacterium]|nr:hypothetical protein [Arthrobacter sp.]